MLNSLQNKIIILSIIATSYIGVPLAKAETTIESPVINATKEVEVSAQTLASAKDTNLDDLALRIETFKKVVELSLSEATELKVKLVLAEPKKLSETEDKPENIWYESTLTRLNNTLKFLDTQTAIDFSSVTSTEAIKTTARDFKIWREANYVPIAEEINDFLLIEKGSRVLKVAKNRAEKIQTDIIKLEEAKIEGVSSLSAMLLKATNSILESKKNIIKAKNNFTEKYIEPLIKPIKPTNTTELTNNNNDVSATTTPPKPKTPEKITQDIILKGVATTTATTTPEKIKVIEVDPVISIRDLVRSSFTDMKDAYQIFIEMSNFVRKLL